MRLSHSCVIFLMWVTLLGSDSYYLDIVWSVTSCFALFTSYRIRVWLWLLTRKWYSQIDIFKFNRNLVKQCTSRKYRNILRIGLFIFYAITTLLRFLTWKPTINRNFLKQHSAYLDAIQNMAFNVFYQNAQWRAYIHIDLIKAHFHVCRRVCQFKDANMPELF